MSSLSRYAQSVVQITLVSRVYHCSVTVLPYDYFRKYFKEGAPRAFVIQNKTPHCCIINAKRLILLWLNVILEGRLQANGVLRRVAGNRGWNAFIAAHDSGTKDDWGTRTSEVRDE